MGFYSQFILPRLLDWSMSSPALAQHRQEILSDVRGEVLEIGFGTGLNLDHYPPQVQAIATVDINPGMNAIAQRRIAASTIQVNHHVLNGESLPMADNTFDYVVSTWTLCSIAQVDRAIQEIYRVLKPGGKFVFIEHGLSDRPNIQVWQHRLTPIQKRLADGCHLDRNIQILIEHQFSHVKLEQFVIDQLPSVFAYTYKGVATKP